MFYIIQSNDTDILVGHLANFYQTHADDVLADFVVITPARALEDWLKKSIAKKLGMSALLTGQFWGQYQWQIIKKVIDMNARHIAQYKLADDVLSVPEIAVLSASVIRWQIFSYMSNTQNQQIILSDKTHPLFQLLLTVCHESWTVDNKKLWQLSNNLSKILVQYLTQRHDWLVLWLNDKHINVQALIEKKDQWQDIYLKKEEESEQTITPEWIVDYYIDLEKSLQFLWKTLFAHTFKKRLALEQRFWQCLNKDYPFLDEIMSILPKNMYLFTVNQLPQIELDFLKKLSMFVDIYLLHFNPSMMFWADIVDKNWLMQQKIINPQSVYYKDYGHALLSRLGKSSRETFAMLAEMAGGDDFNDYQIEWVDDFRTWHPDNDGSISLLSQLKQDILMLEDNLADHMGGVQQDWQQIDHKEYASHLSWQLNAWDDSIMIHSCHNLKRQLEVLRTYIVHWLNQQNADGGIRRPSDIVVFLPDIQNNHRLIRSVFTDTVGVDGFLLPARVTGVSSNLIEQLFNAICGFYYLPTQRFYANDFYDWLLIPALHESIGLTIHEVYRAIDLLNQAGFIRGLDEGHIKQTLHEYDKDYRHTLSYALDKLVASLLYGNHANNDAYYSKLFHPLHDLSVKKTQTIVVQLSDEIIIQKLCFLFNALQNYGSCYDQKDLIVNWLNHIEYRVINRYFGKLKNSEIMRTIFDAMNSIRLSIYSNQNYDHDGMDIQLPLQFVLDAIAQLLTSQQVKSETTGAITFARFGSLRAINFGLVVMLGMDIGVFPRTESANQLDLSKAFLKRRGDRISEDDDNGAFLDAILCAKEACWIFYNGQNMNSDVPLLPATPVIELIRYFKELNWANQDGAFIEDYLITKHSLMPFSDDVFYQYGDANTLSLQKKYHLPPAKIWQDVHQLMQNKRHSYRVVNFPSKDDVCYIQDILLDKTPIDGQLLPDQLTLPQLMWAIKKPAHHFINNRVYVFDKGEIKSKEEALGYDSLLSYTIHRKFIHEYQNKQQRQNILQDEFDYGSDMPAGEMKPYVIQKFSKDFQGLLNQLQEKCRDEFSIENISMDGLKNYMIKIPIDTKQGTHIVYLNAHLPSEKNIIDNEGVFVNILPVKYGKKYHIEAFLTHVVWQLLDKPMTRCHHHSIWQFQSKKDEKDCLIFEPIEYQESLSIITRWIKYYALAKLHILAVGANNIMDYNKLKQNQQMDNYQLFDWLKDDQYQSFVSDDNCTHPVWQYIVKDQSLELLKLSLPIIDILSSDIIAYPPKQ